MSRTPEKYGYVFRYVFGLMALVALAAVTVIVFFYFAQKADRAAHDRVTFYHGEAIEITTRVRQENQSLLRNLGYDIPTIALLAPVESRILGHGPRVQGILRMVETKLGELRQLHRRHGEAEYAATLDRIDDRFRAVQYSISRGDSAESSRRAILSFDLAIEQLHRQHSIAAETMYPDLGSVITRMTPYLSIVALILAATGTITWVALRVLRKSIARQVEMEDALAENVARMHHLEKLESLGRLVGGIAHDFNNLLTAILGQAGLLQERSSDERTQESLAQIQEAGRQAAALTRQLLNFGRPTAVETRVVNVNQVIGDAEAMLARTIGEDVEIHIDYAADLYPVKLDPGQLQQVIVNLVVNARDAMPDGGRLSIATKNVHLGSSAAQAAAVPVGQYVKITVSDTGIGMDEHIRERVFEPYFTTKQPGRGTGLGLATIYGIVTAAQGHVSVSSRPGAGSRFDILLPRTTEPDLSSDSDAAVAEHITGDETIVVVEDEQQIREFLRQGLESLGYRVLLAADASEALELCSAGDNRIDLILADVIMPGMNGAELLTRARQLVPHASAILMSGYTDDILERTGVDRSEIPLIPKPFEIAEVALLIREQLAENSRQQAAALAS